ncbi:MAG TPA: FAD-dependent monooxygenase [Chthoniobacterales bacterium]|jgi:2-polyprenyl-6-methoxyphenol hydroxylase-like FAD-dependent oxidoreductase
MQTDSSVPLVIGAGPVGLTMANELARHGVRSRIIERAPERSQTSKALGVFPRTLEIFETMGLADRFLAVGHRIHGLSMHHGAEQIAQIDFTSVASPFPFALGVPQSETERLLIERLAEFDIEVERSLELTGLTQTPEAVRATLRRADGTEETVETPWLIGCDGAHSTTRHALGMEFEGAPYDESFILADVQLAATLTRDRLHLFLSDEGILGLIPFAENRWRIVANIPPESRDQNLPDPVLPEVQEILDRRATPVSVRASDPVWLARFHISHRKVRQFRDRRAFLAGDAAHIHSPAGGQGMNTGIQDAFNLAWKLALVVRGVPPAQLLASYHAERDPVASGVLNLTDRLTRMATVRNSIAQNVRDFLLPMVSGIDFVTDKIADRLTELSVNYRHSSIVEGHGAGGPKAGDRAPDAELRNERNEARRLFELFQTPRHILLLFLGATGDGQIGPVPRDLIDSYRIARGRGDLSADLRDLAGLAHAAYGLLEGGVLLVRPDGYIAYRSDTFDPIRLQNYLGRVFGAMPAS